MVESLISFSEYSTQHPLSLSSGPQDEHLTLNLRTGEYFGQYKMKQKSWKMTEILAHGYSSESTQWELSNEYQHNRLFSKIFVRYALDECSLSIERGKPVGCCTSRLKSMADSLWA